MKALFGLALLATVATAHGQLTLDNFVFDNNLFGDTLLESDGGAFSFNNWLNVNNVSPGNPGFLTGASFDTGIANIGMNGTNPRYTIGYNTPIVNNVGADLGIVVARYTEDDISFAVSQDGSSFTNNRAYGPQEAFDTGVHYEYFYGGGGPSDAELFVQPIDLSDFGVALGDSIVATRIGGSPQLDLIRVAGFAAVPEPATIWVVGAGLLTLFRRRRK